MTVTISETNLALQRRQFMSGEQNSYDMLPQVAVVRHDRVVSG